MPPVDPTRQHKETNAGNRDYRDNRRNCAKQGPLQPLDSGDDRTGAHGIAKNDLCRCHRRQG